MIENFLKNVRVALVAENASTRFGGEAFIPLQLFQRFNNQGINAFLFVHKRNRLNLKEILSEELYNKVFFIPETTTQKLLHAISYLLPSRVADFSTSYLISLITEKQQKKLLHRMIQKDEIQLIHQCSWVSPRLPSLMYDLDIPCIIGPLNGNMDYPPGFSEKTGFLEKIWIKMGRSLSYHANQSWPGKLKADALIVANDRTMQGLPKEIVGKIYKIVENGVDIDLWNSSETQQNSNNPHNPITFVYSGSFVDVKSIDLLLFAFEKVVSKINAQLLCIGDGPLKTRMQKLTKKLEIDHKVTFMDWLSQKQLAQQYASADVFVFPSLRDCGGAVVLEAMAMELPIIATRWGGPIDYVDKKFGFLIDPLSREQYIEDFSKAMLQLAHSPDLRKEMGHQARKKVLEHFQWSSKIEKFIQVYIDVLSQEKNHKKKSN